MLADLEGLTAPEIADALGVTLNTVYSRLRRARADLDAALAPAPTLMAELGRGTPHGRTG